MKRSRSTAAFSPDDMRRGDEGSDLLGAEPDEAQARDLASTVEVAGFTGHKPHISPVVLVGFVRLLEFILLCATAELVHLIYVVPHHGYDPAYLIAIPSISGFGIVMFQIFNVNSVAAFRSPVQQGFRIACAWTAVVLVVLAVVFFLKVDTTFSRVWMMGTYCFGLMALLVERGVLMLVTRSLTRSGRLDRRTVIVGGGHAGETLLQALSNQVDTDIRICGVFDDRSDDRSPSQLAGYSKLGNVDDLVAIARHTRIDLIIFTLPITAEQRLLQMLRKLWVLPIDIRLSAHMNKLKLRPRSYSYIGSVPVLDVFDKPIADWDVVIKSIFDRIFAAFAVVLLSPILMLTALAVKLDSAGPILFKQRRYGFNNELIEIYKFRSMYIESIDHDASKLVTRGDPRVTRVGRFIRRTSIDELPQLFNVLLKGNLSLVGPRPHAVHAKAADRQYDVVVDGYFARHRVRPGITGWAQVNGWRGETDTPDKIQNRVEHDLAYIENWSLFFDLYILLITPFALFKTDNAY